MTDETALVLVAVVDLLARSRPANASPAGRTNPRTRPVADLAADPKLAATPRASFTHFPPSTSSNPARSPAKARRRTP